MNVFSSLDETYSKFLLAPTGELIRFWGSKVKVTAGRQGRESIHIDISQSPPSASRLFSITMCLDVSMHV